MGRRFLFPLPMLGRIGILVLSLFLIASRSAHEYHASVTNMQYNPKEHSFEISVRMFTDDLEKALTKENGGQRVVFSAANTTKNDPILEKYVRRHFAVLTPQKQRKSFDYIGHETEADAQWIYLELPYAEAFRGGQMQQSVLTDLFDDQVNLVTISYNGQKKTFLFKKNQTVQDISF